MGRPRACAIEIVSDVCPGSIRYLPRCACRWEGAFVASWGEALFDGQAHLSTFAAARDQRVARRRLENAAPALLAAARNALARLDREDAERREKGQPTPHDGVLGSVNDQLRAAIRAAEEPKPGPELAPGPKMTKRQAEALAAESTGGWTAGKVGRRLKSKRWW